MNKVKKLQAQLKEGKITKAQYEAEIKKLLEADEIDQEDYDEAKTYDPAAEEKIYSQAEVDSFIAKKATQLLRKMCKDAGVDIDGVSNKDLTAHVTEVLKGKPGETGKGKGDKADDAEVAKLQKKAAKVDALLAQLKAVSVELAVIKELTTGDYKGANPVQVLRAVRLDYMDTIDVEEDGDAIKVDRSSVTRTIKTIKKAEPTLFKTAAASDDGDQEDDDQEDEDDGDSGTFKGKGPGGGGKPASGKNLEAQTKKALELMGYKQETTK
jgi:hypothetical protein